MRSFIWRLIAFYGFRNLLILRNHPESTYPDRHRLDCSDFFVCFQDLAVGRILFSEFFIFIDLPQHSKKERVKVRFNKYIV